MTDPFGRQTTFTYDASNQHLLSVQEPDGTVYSYTYDTGTGAATQNALLSITEPDGTFSSTSPTTPWAGWTAPRRTAAPSRSPSPTARRRGQRDRRHGRHNSVLLRQPWSARQDGRPAGQPELPVVRRQLQPDPVDRRRRSHRTLYTYDSQGNLTGVDRSPGQLRPRFTYTGPFNELTSLTDANGNVTHTPTTPTAT